MKKILAFCLALCMIFALCACGSTSASGSAQTGDGQYQKLSIDMSCNGQSDAANDCIGANLFKQYIEEQSGGAITVTIYNNDQLAGGDMTKGLELVMDGTVQMDIHSTSIISRIDAPPSSPKNAEPILISTVSSIFSCAFSDRSFFSRIPL